MLIDYYKRSRASTNCVKPFEGTELNGEFRDREKVVRGLKKKDSPLLSGCQIYHNYVRPHMALDEKTPAEACGIKIEGGNKWLTLIQNAKKKN